MRDFNIQRKRHLMIYKKTLIALQLMASALTIAIQASYKDMYGGNNSGYQAAYRQTGSDLTGRPSNVYREKKEYPQEHPWSESEQMGQEQGVIPEQEQRTEPLDRESFRAQNYINNSAK